MQDTGSLAARMRHSAGMRRYWGTMKRLIEECDEAALALDAEMAFTTDQNIAEAVNAQLLQLAPPKSAGSAAADLAMPPITAGEAAVCAEATAGGSAEQLQQHVLQLGAESTAAPMQSQQPALADITARPDATAAASAAAGDDGMAAVLATADISATATIDTAAAAGTAAGDDAMQFAAAVAGAAVDDDDKQLDVEVRSSGKKRRRVGETDSTATAAPAAVVQYGQDPKQFLKGVCIYIVGRGSISSKMIEVSQSLVL